MPIFNDNLQTIGGTPLVRIQRLTAGLPGRVLVQIEGRNPAYSVKCRIAILPAAAERYLSTGLFEHCQSPVRSGDRSTVVDLGDSP